MHQGIVFIVRHPALSWIMFAQLVTAILTRPYSQLVPAFAVNLLHGGARGLGWAGLRCRRRRIRRARSSPHIARTTRAPLAVSGFSLRSSCRWASWCSPSCRRRWRVSLPDSLPAIGRRHARIDGGDQYAAAGAVARRSARARDGGLYDDCDRRRAGWARSSMVRIVQPR